MIRDVASALAALTSGQAERLLGIRECAWLDAKGQPYQLDEARWAGELAKDVAALANAEGGLIVIGLKTRRDNGNDVIDEIRPVRTTLITTDRYRKVVREQVFPFVTDFAARWVAVDDERGLLVLDVPTQAARDKPFVMSGVEGIEGAPSGSTAAVPLRDDDGTHWLSRQDLQRLLSAGWNVTGPPEPRVVIAAAEQVPSVAVGEGDPLWIAAFRQAYESAGGRPVLGDPLDVVTTNGPGVAQHLSGDARGPAAVFALPDHEPVVVTGDLFSFFFSFFLKLCRDSSQADDARQVGLPVSDERDATGRRVIRLDGGTWGPGVLIQSAAGAWRWEPVPTVGRLWALNADRWSYLGTPQSTPDLVLRVDAFLPLEFARGAAPSYPGSPLLAMMLLGHACRYVFCDTDPASVADLHAARERLGLRDKVRLVHDDGLATTTALLQAQAIGAASLVHVDPFDFRAAGPGIVSALELVTCLAAASIPTFAWYGLTAPSAAHELFHEVTAAVPATRAWCAELRVGGRRANAAGIGSGCGILFAAADLAPVGSMRRAADAYVRAFNEQSVAADSGVCVTASFITSASDAS